MRVLGADEVLRRGVGGMHAIDFDRQVQRAAQDRARPVRRRVHEQARVLQPPGQGLERDLDLQAREGCAEAVVDAAAVGEVLPGLAVLALGVEAVGVGEPAPRRGCRPRPPG